MRELFYKLIQEANTGMVNIDNDSWPIGWNTIIYDNNKIKYQNLNDNNFPTLVIKNEDKFFEFLEKYLKLELKINRKSINFVTDQEQNKIKLLIAYLFTNATTEDFLNPISYIKRCISFLEDNTFDYLNNSECIKLGDMFDCDLEIINEKQSILMETPNKIKISFVRWNGDIKLSYDLPSISYGICNNNNEKECYIYSILNKKEVPFSLEDEKFKKEISRKLYKLNKDVLDQESEDYLDYREGISDYYPENISDVSPSAVMSLVIFLSLLKGNDIVKVRGVSYLPVRYLSRNIAANNIADESKKDELKKRNNFIQTNITDKFIRTIRRAAYHMEGIEIVSLPYEYDEFINLKVVNGKTNTNNELLNEVTGSISNKIK